MSILYVSQAQLELAKSCGEFASAQQLREELWAMQVGVLWDQIAQNVRVLY